MNQLVLFDFGPSFVEMPLVWRHDLAETLRGVVPHVAPDDFVEHETDRWQVHDLLEQNGVWSGEVEAATTQALSQFALAFSQRREQIGASLRVPSWLRNFLGLAAESRIFTSVLTPRSASLAVTVLTALRLDPVLDLEAGAYGNDRPRYFDLLEVCLQRFERLRNQEFADENIWIVGSSALTADLARDNNVRSVLVLTPGSDASMLESARADAVVKHEEFAAFFKLAP